MFPLPPRLPLFALAAVLVSLAGTALAAPAARSVVLTGKAGESPFIALALGTFTLLVLDAPIVRESVQVEGRARFSRVDPADQGITLALAEPLGPTERLALRFSYREGFPTSVVFLLTGAQGEADTVVNVSRPKQTLEVCREALSATRERWEAQSRELEDLQARPPVASPAAMALAGFLDAKGVQATELERACLREATGELRPVHCNSFRASTWAVVVLVVRNTGAAPWTPEWAEVSRGAGGAPRRARTVLPAHVTISPGGTATLAVEVAMPLGIQQPGRQELYSLRVCDVAGSRCVVVSNVTL
ncbi:DUF2381 family protein [Hyalangium versicolor]|uniref:DUF2381 family protein n=1 Tax=Hyalangium versicolor TaxID=2861190 RepID=UPI001CCDDFDD|nr:DUF2381 family protein [Hyalangium versicolor]